MSILVYQNPKLKIAFLVPKPNVTPGRTLLIRRRGFALGRSPRQARDGRMVRAGGISLELGGRRRQLRFCVTSQMASQNGCPAILYSCHCLMLCSKARSGILIAFSGRTAVTARQIRWRGAQRARLPSWWARNSLIRRLCSCEQSSLF